jgi:adenylate kinase
MKRTLLQQWTRGTASVTRAAFSTAQAQQQIHLMLFGAPGVGKGTYSKLIEKEFDFHTFSMGDYFRKVINNSATNEAGPFIVKLKQILRSG